LSHYASPLMFSIFEIGPHELFVQIGFEP
jgi:hypothetical protein